MRLPISLGLTILALAARAAEVTPTGQTLTPAAAPGSLFQPLNPDLPGDPAFTAGQAASLAMSPDGKTLLILTSGFNRAVGPDGRFIPDRSKEYIFIYDVSGPAPVKRQVITAPNTFLGLAWAPAGDRFFVSGGVDDNVMEFVGPPGSIRAGRVFPLGHRGGLGHAVRPEAAGIAVSPDGRRLLVANFQNDSISLIDLTDGVVAETDLRPGVVDKAHAGGPGGTFPHAVTWTSATRAYVTSQRDREVISLDLVSNRFAVGARLHTSGQPVALLAAPTGRLYAALDNTDGVAVIDARADRVLETFATAAPPGAVNKTLGGAGSNALALSPNGRTLLVTNGAENALAMVALDPRPGKSAVVGLVPTGWYPTAVAVRPDGRQI